MYLPDLFAVLPDDRAERWRRLATFIEGWWGPLTPEHGTPEDELRQAEARLGPLPAALREAHARFGRRVEIAESFETLVRVPFLTRPDDLLVFWFSASLEWYIDDSDLARADPPVRLRAYVDHQWEPHPALPHDPCVSRFLLWKALEQATVGSRYGNVTGALGDVEPLAAEVGRRFPILDFGLVEHPLPSTRLYGGEDALIAVMAGAEVRVTVSAPNLAGYRRAMDALRDLALPWKVAPDVEAYRGEFHEQWTPLGAEGRKHSASVKASLRGERDAPVRVASDDSATGSASDLDPRVAVHVEAALRPYQKLLPWLCLGHLRAALEHAIETGTPLEACANVLVGKPATDDVVMPPLEPLPPETEARLQALGVSAEARAYVDALRGSGMIDRFIGAGLRRQARSTPDRPLSKTEEREADMMDDAEDCLSDLLYELPMEPLPDRAAAEASLSRALRRLAASAFAGVLGVLGPGLHFRFLRACFLRSQLPSSREDRQLFQTYFVARQGLVDIAKERGVSVSVEVERQCVYLDAVAAAVEEAAAEAIEHDADE